MLRAGLSVIRRWWLLVSIFSHIQEIERVCWDEHSYSWLGAKLKFRGLLLRWVMPLKFLKSGFHDGRVKWLANLYFKSPWNWTKWSQTTISGLDQSTQGKQIDMDNHWTLVKSSSPPPSLCPREAAELRAWSCLWAQWLCCPRGWPGLES